MPTGQLVRFRADRGFGFLERGDAPGDVFVHISELERAGVDAPRIGDAFAFEIYEQDDGKNRAIDLELLDDETVAG